MAPRGSDQAAIPCDMGHCKQSDHGHVATTLTSQSFVVVPLHQVAHHTAPESIW